MNLYKSLLLALSLTLLSLLNSAGAQQRVSTDTTRFKQQLGCEIFFNASVLSLNGKMSCATCHDPNPKFGWSNGLAIAVGFVASNNSPLGIRNVPSLIGCKRYLKRPSNWDGRANGLAESCLQAVADPNVFAMPSLQASVDRMNQVPRLRELSQPGYGTPDITVPIFRDAMVEFICMIDSPDCPADRLAVGLTTSLPDSALRGWKLFEANCTHCHIPELDWQDGKFHNIGISSRSANDDRLRGTQIGAAGDWMARTPSLRECVKTSPFMHDGSMKTLDDVVAYFAVGCQYGRRNQFGVLEPFEDPTRDESVKSIRLSKSQCADLVSFLELGFQGEHYPFIEPPSNTRIVANGNSR